MHDSRQAESYDVPGMATAARSLSQQEPDADGRRGGSLRVLGARRPAAGEDDEADYRGTRPLPRRSWRRRLAFTAAKVLAVVIALVLAAIAALYFFTPSAGQATALAAAQAREHHIAYPGPPVPQYFADALVATEDHRFYTDPGVDPLALVRVAASWLTGHTDGGGSTVDQQLAKNLYTSGDSSFPQIVEQVALAVKLNHTYSRAEILRLYAEIAYYGHGYYGLQAASCGYFGRPPDQLTVVQAAMLAGAVNAPSYDDPLVYPTQARARLVHVLDRMAAVGYLTKAQEDAALNAPLGLPAVRGCR
jgi:membrane peptidoglycan carboxypeptidase